MRRIILLLAVAAFLVPAAALAAKPPHPTTPATPATPTVAYILHGTLTAYTPANGGTGSVTIKVKSAVSGTNHVAAPAFKGQTVTLIVTSSTKVTLHNGVFTANDNGTVKFRAKKGASTTGQTATQVIDQGPSS
jgi:hypothetical protein